MDTMVAGRVIGDIGVTVGVLIIEEVTEEGTQEVITNGMA